MLYPMVASEISFVGNAIALFTGERFKNVEKPPLCSLKKNNKRVSSTKVPGSSLGGQKEP